MGQSYAHEILNEISSKGYSVESYIEDKFVRNEWRGIEYYQSLKEAALTQFASNGELRNRIYQHCDNKIEVLSIQIQRENERKDNETRLAALVVKNLELANGQLGQRRTTFVIGGLVGLLASIVGGMLPVLVDRCSTPKIDTSQVHILNYPAIPDTMRTFIIDFPSDTSRRNRPR